MIQIKTPKDVQKLGTILSVWAHPDDETFTAGGLLHIAAKNGQKVICVTATKGELGVYDDKWPAEQMAQIREQEMYKADEIIGITKQHWLGYKDGLCESTDKLKAAQEIAEIIKECQPDTILTFGKDGITGHSDHCCVSCWVDDAVELSDKKPNIYHAVHTVEQYENYLRKLDEKLDIFFNIDKPPIFEPENCQIYLVLDDEPIKTKVEALKAMRSQTERMFAGFDQEFLEGAFATEAFVTG